MCKYLFSICVSRLYDPQLSLAPVPGGVVGLLLLAERQEDSVSHALPLAVHRVPANMEHWSLGSQGKGRQHGVVKPTPAATTCSEYHILMAFV